MKKINKIDVLQQENQLLKAEIKFYQTMYFDKLTIINNAIDFCKLQKRKMYKNKNKIAVFVLNELLEILKGSVN